MRGRALALLAALLLGCQSGGTSAQRQGDVRPRQSATTLTPADALKMDCQSHADCTQRPETLCHRAVAGGTCAPPCEDDAACAGLGHQLRCSEGTCQPAGASDGGASR